ncbi:MAG: LysM peptidoglycan-binding domain-containing protein [Chloroflexota bacterium]
MFVLLPMLAACGGVAGTNGPIKLVVTPVASPTTTPLAAPTAPPVTYTVKPGDTLSGIADLFGVTVDDIVRYNNIADPNSLSEGQVLIIPGRAPTPTPAATMTGTPAPAITATQGITSTSTPVLPPPDVTPPMGPTTPPEAGQ